MARKILIKNKIPAPVGTFLILKNDHINLYKYRPNKIAKKLAKKYILTNKFQVYRIKNFIYIKNITN